VIEHALQEKIKQNKNFIVFSKEKMNDLDDLGLKQFLSLKDEKTQCSFCLRKEKPEALCYFRRRIFCQKHFHR